MLISIFIFFIASLLFGIPIAFGLGLTGLFGLLMSTGTDILIVIPQKIFSGMNTYVLMAIPFFIMSGEMMNAIGMTNRIVNLSNLLVGRFSGGLGHVNILASIFFSGISGSAVADVAALGSILIPTMTKSGYSKPYATALTAASSIIGPTIPPSIPIIIYASVISTSIAALFSAALLPGLLMGFFMMITNYTISKRRHYQIETISISPSEAKNIFIEGLWALGMPFIILGGILGGIFTPTEAAAIAVGYSFIVGVFIFKTLNISILKKVLQKTVSISGVSLLLVSMGGIIGWVLASEQIPESLARVILGFTSNRYMFLFLVSIFLLIIGCFMDLTASIIILAPIFAPMAIKYGISPIHFAITMILALNIGLNTPPVGAVLFVASSIGQERIENIVKEIWPFFVCEVIALALVVYFPSVSQLIPHILGLI